MDEKGGEPKVYKSYEIVLLLIILFLLFYYQDLHLLSYLERQDIEGFAGFYPPNFHLMFIAIGTLIPYLRLKRNDEVLLKAIVISSALYLAAAIFHILLRGLPFAPFNLYILISVGYTLGIFIFSIRGKLFRSR